MSSSEAGDDYFPMMDSHNKYFLMNFITIYAETGWRGRQVSINISKKEVCQHFLNVYKSKLNNSTRSRLLYRASYTLIIIRRANISLSLEMYNISPCLPCWSLTTTCGTKVMSIKLMKVLSSQSFYLSRPYTSYFCLSKPVRPL